MSFQPTAEQTAAAQNVLVARAFYTIVQQDFNTWTKQITASGASLNTKKNIENPNEHFILQLGMKAHAAGYLDKQFTLEKALQDVIAYEDTLVTLTPEIHQEKNFTITDYKFKRDLSDFVLLHFNEQDLRPNLHIKEQKYFNERRSPLPTANPQSFFDADTLRKFLSYKHLIDKYYIFRGTVKRNEGINFKKVIGAWLYFPGFYIFEIDVYDQKEGWEYQPGKYSYRNFAVYLNCQFYDSDVIEELEYLLFAEYVKYLHTLS